jgi:hypothetical protein
LRELNTQREKGWGLGGIFATTHCEEEKKESDKFFHAGCR